MQDDFSALVPPSFQHLMAKRGGCLIPETEHRAITLHQLQQIVEHMRDSISSKPWEYTKRGRTYYVDDPSRATLYDVKAMIIVPATEGRKCSMVELMAVGPQLPE